MNLKEGMRRTGIVLGILGMCAGGILAYADASPVWQTWREHKRFQALLATPTVRRASGADWIKKHAPVPVSEKSCDKPDLSSLTDGELQSYKNLSTKTQREGLASLSIGELQSYKNILTKTHARDPTACYETNSGDKGKLHWIEVQPWERDWSKEQLPVREQIVEVVFRLESFEPDANRDGIDGINYASDGTVTSLQLATGEKIERPQSPSFLRAFFVPLVFPLVGFVLPWGAVKMIAWVATGFTASKGA